MHRTYSEVLNQGVQTLTEAGVESPDVDAWILFEYIFKMNKAHYYLQMKEQTDEEQEDAYLALVGRRAAQEPVQYLTGHQEFMGLDFMVNESVLIPRLDTEVLVEKCLYWIKKKQLQSTLDLCTGSGAIAVSLKALSDCPHIVASDISEVALEVAKENAKRNQADVTFVHSDLFADITEKFDMIVSNPPYIASAEVDRLDEQVKGHEPRLALDGKEDGLYFYRKIVKEAPKYLRDEGILIMEIGYDQGKSVPELMQAAGFAEIEVIKDLAGLDRIVFGIYK